MSVERRVRDGAVAYVVRWRAGGRARSKSFSAARHGGDRAARRLAKAYDADVQAQLASTGVVRARPEAQTLDVIWTGWWDSGAVRWSQETQETYSSAMDVHVLPHLGRMQLGAITAAEVERWTAALARRGVGPSAARKAVTVLSSLLSWCVRAGYIESNPVRLAVKPPAPRKRTPTKLAPLHVEQIRKALIDAGHMGDATLVSLLAYSGLRPESEALVLDWRDVGDKLHIAPNRKRGAKPRTVDLLAPLADDLRHWRRVSGRVGGLVLPFGGGGVSGFGAEWSGDRWNRWRDRRWRQALADAGIDYAIPRDLRGSFASLLIWEGRSVIDVARQLGHAPSMCLDVYAGEFAEFDPVARCSAETVINEARAVVFGDAQGEFAARRSG